MKKTLLASTAILALSAIGFTNTVHATENPPPKTVTVDEGDVRASLALTNPDVTSVNFDFAQIDFEKEKPLDPREFSVTYDIQNRTFANIAGRFTIDVSTDGAGLDANIKDTSEKVFDISQTNRGTRNTDDVTIEATLDPTLYNDEQKELYKITVSLIDSNTVTP
ncbi:hypothetical protein AL523_12475 [Enterococcus gallinarum]|nr:hypothetical protein AL523_12475 [Enterococcus gallinarum]